MSIDQFSSGDNWHEAYISGFDNIVEKIIEDRESHPRSYEDWEIDLIDTDWTKLSGDQEVNYWKSLRNYAEEWISSRL